MQKFNLFLILVVGSIVYLLTYIYLLYFMFYFGKDCSCLQTWQTHFIKAYLIINLINFVYLLINFITFNNVPTWTFMPLSVLQLAFIPITIMFITELEQCGCYRHNSKEMFVLLVVVQIILHAILIISYFYKKMITILQD